jgi:hypothetical protein
LLSLIILSALLNLLEHNARPALKLRIAFSIEKSQRVVGVNERTRKRRLIGNARQPSIASPTRSTAARAPRKQGALLG